MVNRRDTVMVRLLYACCKALGSRGMTGAFLDGLKSNESGVETLGEKKMWVCDFVADIYGPGFRRWAQYREVWHHI